MFYYGTFTQLIDDLEDVQIDLQKGLNTIYSQTARHWPLDASDQPYLSLLGAGDDRAGGI